MCRLNVGLVISCFYDEMTLTLPRNMVHSGVQPPGGTVEGNMVALTKSELLLQIEGNATPQLISFQNP